MPYVNIPKDLTVVKTKVLFGLTLRQLICFALAAAVGIPTYIFSRAAIGNDGAVFLMIGLMLPFFFLAMYQKDGQSAEKILRNILRSKWFYPVKRPHKTKNLYSTLVKEERTVEKAKTKLPAIRKKAVR